MKRGDKEEAFKKYVYLKRYNYLMESIGAGMKQAVGDPQIADVN